MCRHSVKFLVVWTALFNTLTFCKSFAGSACLEIHNFSSQDIQANYVKNVVDYMESGTLKAGAVSSGLVYNVQPNDKDLLVCILEDVGKLVANPTGRGTITLSFAPFEQSTSLTVGVYTSGRSNFHVIVADNQEDLHRSFNTKFGHREDCDQEEDWYSVQENGSFKPLAGLGNE